MTCTRIDAAAFLGLDAVRVEVEVDVTPAEFPSITLVGLPDTAIKESKERVLAALKNTGFKLEKEKAIVNLAPADVRKTGTLYDLPIALGILHALKVFRASSLSAYLCIGEVALDGTVRPVHGVLAAAMLARGLGKKGILVPQENAREASIVLGLDVIPIAHLKEALSFFQNAKTISPLRSSPTDLISEGFSPLVDFAAIKGQAHAKRALEIAAAGGHNVLLSGPPGSGKTLLARAFEGIIPELTFEEALEVTKIHSIAGLLKPKERLVLRRPFRSPHHTVSYAGMIGGGSTPRPGEVSLAHRGILFLDELPEFSRKTLESLRQPLEDRFVTISRAKGSLSFQTDFICIAAMNPCPCGFSGHPEKTCRDSQAEIERYQRKVSGPVLDRLDMLIVVPPVRYHEMVAEEEIENSERIRKRVAHAGHIQQNRLQKRNAQMNAQEVQQYIPLDRKSQLLVRDAMEAMGISARGIHRLLKVARTIADLANQETISEDHLSEALSFRSFS